MANLNKTNSSFGQPASQFVTNTLIVDSAANGIDRGWQGTTATLEVGLDSEGRFVLPFVRPGSGVFERASGDGTAPIWTAIGTAEVGA